MRFSVYGFNHRNLSLEARERFQIARQELEQANRLFQEISGCAEVVVVATCHRMEFYRVRTQKGDPRTEFTAFYQRLGIAGSEKTAESCYHLHETSAARHLFRVAAGLDSLVLGEDQIFHQLKDAYSAACAASSAGKILHKAFHLAFQIGKRIRSETGLGSGPRGIPGAALDLLKNRLDGKIPSAALVCGVNETTEIILDGLARWGVPVLLANRTLKKAERLAAAFKAKPMGLDNLGEALEQVEVVFSATAAPQFVISAKHLNKRKQHRHPLYLVDLAVPRDIDPQVGQARGVELFDLQDVQRYLEHSQSQRAGEIPAAEAMIEEQVKAYSQWRRMERQRGKLLDLRREINRLRRDQVERYKEGFRPSQYRALESFSQALARDFMRLAPGMLEEEGSGESK